MSMAMAATTFVPVASRSLARIGTAKLPTHLVLCEANGATNDQQQQSICSGPSTAGPLRLSAAAVAMPMLAAAVVGSVSPAVQASEWEKILAPVDYTETSSSSTDEPYKELLEKMKERRVARGGNRAQTTQTDEKNSDAYASIFPSSLSSAPRPSPFFSPAPGYAPPPAAPAVEAPEPAPIVASPSPAESVALVETATKQKTHGFLPLFLAQFFLLGAILGGGYVLITTPDSEWEEVRKTVDGVVEQATPVIEDSWKKAQALTIQAKEKGSQFVGIAKPYAVKAWETAKPLGAKAFEASKPILKRLNQSAEGRGVSGVNGIWFGILYQ